MRVEKFAIAGELRQELKTGNCFASLPNEEGRVYAGR